MTSGAMYLMVPTALVRVCSSFFAVPKSHSFRTRPLSNKRTLHTHTHTHTHTYIRIHTAPVGVETKVSHVQK